ncbi:MAG: TIR domain-containing protein [Ilumatobacter sp.]|uniref:pYEATS domain-containing protein n=1 Tax=Ilumatobacter sp. TaxID=1967498 RepID=UPI002616BD7F|nr:pYEATS domain-containing protein [Ilumatobacter sp.]MDJ0770956.1 TIR domain-containing protein [Ilumatobacter sp.]
MSLRIAQDSDYRGENSWAWSVWIEGDELDQVDHVAWHLHPTFPEPIRWRSDRSDAFRLEARGWGEFEIKATLYDEAGQPTVLTHWIELGGAERSAPSKGRVFISASLRDTAVVDRLRSELQYEGVQAEDSQSALAGEDWETGIETSISRAQVVMPVVKGEISPIVEEEIDMAVAADKPILPILVGETDVPESLARFQVVQVADDDDVGDAVAAAHQYLA